MMEYDQDGGFGVGWAFPPSFDYHSGSVELASGNQDIRESLMILMRTRVGERIEEREYGCDLMPLAFQQLDLNLKTFMVNNIKQSIATYEPRVDVVKVELTEANDGQGSIDIRVLYKVKNQEGIEELNYNYQPTLA